MKKYEPLKQKEVVPDTILIADDDVINRAILNEIFKDTYRIEEAENGEECLKKLLAQKERICALLLDVVMPVMDGLQLLKELKDRNLLELIPVFLITAEANERIIKEGYDLGVMDVIVKPVTPHIVRRRVDSIVELFVSRRKMRRIVQRQNMELIDKDVEIMRLNMGMVEALATAIEFRSGESGEHVQRISGITRYLLKTTRLGEGISDEAVELISMASIMHDIGKIAIDDAILNKPGRLTPDEYEIMKTHTTQGAHLLEKITQLRNHKVFGYAYDIALHHHERWDGRGYPEGLKGNDISIWSQIVSLADVYDALISKRVYKDAYSSEKTLKMICGGECGEFNPELLKQFVNSENEIRELFY